MIRSCYILLICTVVLMAGGCAKKAAPPQPTPAEEMMTLLPDDVLAFAATSGGEEIKPAFEKSILGRIWHDADVQALCERAKGELFARMDQRGSDANSLGLAKIVLDSVRTALDRPMVVGVAGKEADEGPPVYGFAIIDARGHKSEITAKLEVLEGSADEGQIVEVTVGSLKMHGPKGNENAPGYWGWVGDYFVFAVNDDAGLAVKYIEQPRTAAPDYLDKVPGTNDAVAVYVDFQRIREISGNFAEIAEATDRHDLAVGIMKKLGLWNVEAVVGRVGFAGGDIVGNVFVKVPQPRTGLLAGFKAIDIKMLDMVDSRAVRAAVVNCDFAGIAGTIADAVPEAGTSFLAKMIQDGIGEFEFMTEVDLRKGLVESLAGAVVVYALPAGVMMESPNGGFVAIAALKDGALLEKTMAALGEFASAASDGEVKVRSEVRKDGKTFYSLVAGPLAMMQIIPCWMVVDEHIVIASNPAVHKVAVAQMTAGKAKSIRATEGYKKVAAELPRNLIYFSYVDSKVQFKQMMLAVQQFWPMVLMFAANQGNAELPTMLPSFDEIAEDMGPSCRYSWFDADGLHAHHRGPGAEISVGSAAGGALAVAIVLPALARIGGSAKRMLSGTNLSGIGKACLIYASDYDDKYPPNLEELIDKAELTPKSLESPFKPEGSDEPSYIYITGQTTAMDPRNIIVYENPAFSSEGVNVLYLDGHTVWTKPEDFLRDLEETYKRLGGEMPEIEFKESDMIMPVDELDAIPAPDEKKL